MYFWKMGNRLMLNTQNYIVSCFDYAVKVAGFMNMVGFQNHELSSHLIAVKMEYDFMQNLKTHILLKP